MDGVRSPLSRRQIVALVAPTPFANSSWVRPLFSRYSRSLLMPPCCHDGNTNATEKLPGWRTTALATRPIVSTMVTRIGPRRPIKLYIAEWREHRRLTQQQLADRIGSSKSTISRWESNSRDLTVNAMAAIAEALDCKVADMHRPPNQPTADDLMRDMDAGMTSSGDPRDRSSQNRYERIGAQKWQPVTG